MARCSMQLRAGAGTLLTLSFLPPSTSSELRNPVWHKQRWPMKSWSFPWPPSWSNQQIFLPSINCSRWSTGSALLLEVERKKRGCDTKPSISTHPTPPQEQSYQDGSLCLCPWSSPLTTKTNSCREPTVLSLTASHKQGLSILPILPLFFKLDRGGKLSCCSSGHGWPPRLCWLLAGCCGVQGVGAVPTPGSKVCFQVPSHAELAAEHSHAFKMPSECKLSLPHCFFPSQRVRSCWEK